MAPLENDAIFFVTVAVALMPVIGSSPPMRSPRSNDVPEAADVTDFGPRFTAEQQLQPNRKREISGFIPAPRFQAQS